MLGFLYGDLGRLRTERAGILHEPIVCMYYVDHVQKSRRYMWKIWSQIRHPVQKLWTLEVRWDVHPKLYLGVFLYFQSVFLYFRPLVRTRLSLLIQNVTLESEFGDLSPKLWLSGSFWCLHTKLHLGRIWGVFLVFPDRICVCLTSRADRARSEVSENHLGKWNRRSESKVMDVQRQAKSQYFCLRASLNPSVTSPT